MISPDAADDARNDDEVAVVVAAIDTSNLGSRIVEYAARIARRTWPNSQLHLVHVFRSAAFDRPASVGLNRQDIVDEARSYLEYQLRSARRQCPAPVVSHFAEGDAVEEVLKVARSVGADLLLVGTHDTSGLERLLLGSVATKLAKRAPCSVLIVRQKQRPYVKIGASLAGADE
jgi:universal stress protein A